MRLLRLIGAIKIRLAKMFDGRGLLGAEKNAQERQHEAAVPERGRKPVSVLHVVPGE